MARFEVQHLGDVGQRQVVLLHHVVERGALVPGCGEIRIGADQPVEDGQRFGGRAVGDGVLRLGQQHLGGR